MDRWRTLVEANDYLVAWWAFDVLVLRLALGYGEGLRLVERLGGGLGRLQAEFWPPMPNFTGAVKDGGNGWRRTKAGK